MWRWMAVMLIAVGGLCLGYWVVCSADHENTAEPPAWASPITGGIVLVGGLILLLTGGRRE